MRLLCVFALMVSSGSLSATETQPNVLFISVDDLNDWIGCLGGHPQALTPNIDRLAARGVLFTNAHCAAPACNPSRAAIFSGLMPSTTGVWSNKSGSLNRNYPDAKILSTAFHDAGYRTLGAGKLFHSKGEKYFDEYFRTEQRWSPFAKDAVKYTPEELPSKETDNPRHLLKDSLGRDVVLPLNRMPSDRSADRNDGESFDWGPFDVPDTDFGDTRVVNWAIEQLERSKQESFFLGVGTYRPHIPLFAPARFFERFEDDPGQLPPVLADDLDDLSETGRRWAREPITAGSHATTMKHNQWRQAVEAYLACTTYVDHEIGRLLDALDASDAADNTIIVLWSDHGWHLGEKEHWGKWTGWERSTRVTLMVALPTTMANGFATAGSRCDQPVSLLDLYPTLAELCNVAAPDDLEGETLVPLLKSPSKSTGRSVVTTFDPGNASVRTDRWRYIRYDDGSEELYDIVNDPNEWTNLAASPSSTPIIKTLRLEADRWDEAAE